MTIKIDFDGTIVHKLYPEVGRMMKDADKYINKLYNEGFNVIIDTARSGRYQGDAEDFLKANGIEYDYINCNLPEAVIMYGGDTRKISADISIDDTNLGGLPMIDEDVDWAMIYDMIHKFIKNGNKW